MIYLHTIRRVIDAKAPPTGDVRCPGHAAHKPTLSIALGIADKLLVCCHAGCEQLAVFDQVRRRPGPLRQTETPKRRRS